MSQHRGHRGFTPAIWVGLAIMIVSEAATLAKIEPFWSWNTPIAWTGFLIFADAVVWRARGDSWMRSAPAEFMLLALVSIPLWVLFEGYNLVISNWQYVGLPESPALRYFGFPAFALEGFTMYVFIRRLFTRGGRAIAL